MFKVNNRNTKTRYEICSKLTIKTPELRRRRKLTSQFVSEKWNLFNNIVVIVAICSGYIVQNCPVIKPFMRQSHKMVKHTQTIRRQIELRTELN